MGKLAPPKCKPALVTVAVVSAPVSAPSPPVASAPPASAPKPVRPKKSSPPDAPPMPVQPEKPTGKVKVFFEDKGYGFIAMDDSTEVFFHVSALTHDKLSKNDMVECDISTRRGKAQATSVTLLKKAPIFRQLCANPACTKSKDRHFEDRCPNSRRR